MAYAFFLIAMQGMARFCLKSLNQVKKGSNMT